MMQRNGAWSSGKSYQYVAILGCLVLAFIMVLNTQMSGEAMWFWYGNVFNGGAKIYSDLHTALQPLFVLETATWIRLFGKNLVIYEIPSLVHAFLLSLGIFLVLRESNWPDGQKAIILFGAFVYVVAGHSYRFDDYHVVAEALITYGLLLLLQIGRPGVLPGTQHELRLVALLGLVCGLTIVTRITDGAALSVASVLSLPFVLKRRKLAGLGLLFLVIALTMVVTVKLTGDTLSAYASSSIFRAAASKGGTGSIFAAPFLVIKYTLSMVKQRKLAVTLVLMFAVAAVIASRFPRAIRFIVPIQLALAALAYVGASAVRRDDLRRGGLFEYLVLVLTLLMYVALAVVIVRFIRHKQGKGSWDPREILIVVPILEWASYSAGAAAEPLTNYYAPVALLLLLIPVVQPFRKYAVWANPSVVTLMLLIAISGISGKIITPYSWQNYKYAGMFQNRQLYHHPVYGEMYIDRDLLRFSEKTCAEIGAVPGKPGPDLLSLPYPYPNYFCNTAPWHNYVQTFFDTATRATVEGMMQELKTNPPRWIIYQRQLNIMIGSERLYNHRQPIAQRALDAFIMGKLSSGQWTLIDESGYLRPNWWKNTKETDWYIIRTKP